MKYQLGAVVSYYRNKHFIESGPHHRSTCAVYTYILCFTFLAIVVWVMPIYDRHKEESFIINTREPIQNVSDKFLSVSLDTSLIQRGWIHKNIESRKLLQRASALAPAYLRVGGTAADCLLFDCAPEDNQLFSPNASYTESFDGGTCSFEGHHCDKQHVNFSMSGQDWIEINQFAKNAGLKLIFDLNVLLRNGTRWDSSNTEQLLQFSEKHGYDVVWQLGNEPNSFQHVFQTSVSGHQLSEDFQALRTLLDSLPRYRDALIIGPDITRPKFLQKESIQYLSDFLQNIGNGTINAVTWHQYYLNGREATEDDFISIDTFNVLKRQIKAIVDVVNKFLPNAPIWMSETSSAYGGGAPGLSDCFLAGFLWLDKLGVAAKMGIKVVVRQSLLGGSYSLLDSHTMEPLPDWWLSVIFKTFVGQTVLNVEHSTGDEGSVRIYCHCTPSSIVFKSITVYGMNLKNEEVYIDIPKLPYIPAFLRYTNAYILTGQDGLLSKSVLMNGNKLQLNPDGSLPPFIPVISDISSPLILPPYSMGFWVLHGIEVPACQQ